MIRLRPLRWLPFLRVLVLGLFAMGLVAEPVLTAAGELHELAHDPSGGHAHIVHAEDVAKEVAAVDEPADNAETLHTLLRFSHCCGTCAAVLPVVKPVAFKPMTGRLVIAQTIIPAQTRHPAPFKPPIFV